MSNSDEFSQCPCTGKTLARMIQPAVLALLAGKPLHGYIIVQQLRQMKMFHDESPDPAGVYRVLRSMEQRGLLTASWDTGRAGQATVHHDRARTGLPEPMGPDSGGICRLHWRATGGNTQRVQRPAGSKLRIACDIRSGARQCYSRWPDSRLTRWT